jgi:hypothetical protein
VRWLSDNVLAKLQGGIAAPLESDIDPETEVDLHLRGQVFGERFAVERWLGSGGMGTVYLAVDRATGLHAVVKLIHPSFVGRDGRSAALAVLKEATALGAVSKLEPHSPNVVRLLGTGTVAADVLAGETLELPWLALEYVDGGDEGSNLEERVGQCLRRTQHAFDAERAARAVAGIANGLDAVHAAGVVHRDVKPANVLCTGAGTMETMKLADFGVSRPINMAATFGGLLVGTAGYAPPELVAVADNDVGSWCDVFGFAALTYLLLAADHYFPLTSIGDALRAAKKPERKRVGDAPRLSPEIRASAAACRALDEALAAATAPNARERTQTAGAFGRAVVDALGHVPPRRASSFGGAGPPSSPFSRAPDAQRFGLVTRGEPGPAASTARAAFDESGACLASAGLGLFVRSEGRFRPAPLRGCERLPRVRFIASLGPRRWLVGGDEASFAVCTPAGVDDPVRGSDPSVRFELFSGELGDLCVLVGTRAGGGDPAPALYALVGRHWLIPLPIRGSASDGPVVLAGIARLDTTRWLLAGRDGAGAYAAIYAPLAWEVTRIAEIRGAPLVACAADGNDSAAIIAADGSVFLLRGSAVRRTSIGAGGPTSVHLEQSGGRVWVGCHGSLWTRSESEGRFTCVHAFEGDAPVIAIASAPRLTALAADFKVIESVR